MNEIVTEVVTISQVGPYGVKVNDVWYGVNEPLTPKSFIAGQTYEVKAKVGKNSKRYIVSFNATAGIDAPKTTLATDYTDRNNTIKRQGLIQAALQSPGLVAFATNSEEYWKLVEAFADRGIKFVENGK